LLATATNLLVNTYKTKSVGYHKPDMTSKNDTLKLLRNLHLYTGTFIAPALLFFAFTGALQTFSLHETTPGSTYKPPTWIATLAQIHKKQTSIIPAKKPRPDAIPQQAPKHEKAQTAEAPQPKPKSHLPLKIFFLLVAIGLFTSTLTGIYMAYKYTRNKRVVTALLLAGVIVPPVLLCF